MTETRTARTIVPLAPGFRPVARRTLAQVAEGFRRLTDERPVTPIRFVGYTSAAQSGLTTEQLKPGTRCAIYEADYPASVDSGGRKRTDQELASAIDGLTAKLISGA